MSLTHIPGQWVPWINHRALQSCPQLPSTTQDVQQNVKHLRKLYPILSFPGASKSLILSQSRVARSFPIQEWLTKG